MSDRCFASGVTFATQRCVLLAVLPLFVAGGAGACNSAESPGTPVLSTRAPTREAPQIAFFRASNGYDIGTADGTGRRLRALTGASRRATVVPQLFARPAWSPDGRAIAFAGVRKGNDPAGFRADIYVMRADGRRQRRITEVNDASDPAWSPGGGTIVFARRRVVGSTLTGSLWAVRSNGSKLRQLTVEAKGRIDRAGTLSPDGSRLAFARVRCAAPNRGGCLSTVSALYTAKRDGSNPQKLQDRASDPAFSPDGTSIAFVSDRDHNGQLNYGDREFFANELYVMRSDGTDQRRLTHTRDLNEASPSWLTEGTRIAFQRGQEIDNAEGMGLFQINADGTCERRLLADPRLDTWYASPAWRPGKSKSGGGTLVCNRLSADH